MKNLLPKVKDIFLKLLSWFLSAKRGVIVTDMSEASILERVMSVNGDCDGRYRCREREGGFVLSEKISRRLYGGMGRVQNDFAPVATARIEEDNGHRRVEYTVRMRYFPWAVTVLMRAIFTFSFLVGIISAAILLISLIGGKEADPELTYYLAMLLALPILELIVYLAYTLPARKLEKRLSELITETTYE